MKVNKIRFSTWLSLVNLVSIIGYLGYFGYWYFQKQPKFSGQRLLLIEVASGIVLLALPFAIELIGKFYFPQIELVFYFVFLYLSIFLGSGLQMYGVPYWDKYEHVLAGIMLAGIGYPIFNSLAHVRSSARTHPGLMSLFSFTFGITCGVFWEFYEFTADSLANLNLQRYAAGSHLLVGRAALMDTMGDLFADVTGALIMALIGYLMIKNNPNSSKYLVFQSKRKQGFSTIHF